MKKYESGNSKEVGSATHKLKPESQVLLKYAYNKLSDSEGNKILKIIETDKDMKSIFEGMVQMKEREKINDIEEHAKFLIEGKRKLNEFFDRFIEE